VVLGVVDVHGGGVHVGLRGGRDGGEGVGAGLCIFAAAGTDRGRAAASATRASWRLFRPGRCLIRHEQRREVIPRGPHSHRAERRG
jgi:hypothetical protein